MATTPGSRRRDTRTDILGEEGDNLTPMQEPIGSMDTPGSRTSSINEVNLPPGETVRRTGNLGSANSPRASTTERGGRSFTATFAIAAVVLLAAFLIALYMGSNRSDVATTNGAQSPIADTTNNGGAANDTTGSTTAPSQQTAPAGGTTGNTTPSQQTAPGTGDANSTTGGTTGTTTPPANP